MYNKYSWQAWHGGGCPVPASCVIEFIRRNNTLYYGENGNITAEPELLNWAHNGSVDDIIAYRIMLMKKVQEIV